MGVYCFLDNLCTISGPGGSIDLAAGAATTKDGITFDSAESLNTMTVGADGSVMHSLHASKAGKATVRLQKTSPQNAALMQMLNFQRTSSLFHGQNVISLANPVTGDDYTNTKVAFSKVPSNTWAEDAGMIEWNFDIGVMDPVLGAGVLDALANTQ